MSTRELVAMRQNDIHTIGENETTLENAQVFEAINLNLLIYLDF